MFRILAALVFIAGLIIGEDKIEVPGEVAVALRAAQAETDQVKALAALAA